MLRSTTDNELALPNLATSTVSRGQWMGAGVAAAVLIAAALAATRAGTAAGPALPTLIPLTAGLACLADLLAAFLLISQYRVTGLTLLVTAGAAFTLSALLMLPYIVSFPGSFVPGTLAGNGQSALWLWAAWHVAFPSIIASYAIVDPGLRDVTPMKSIPKTLLAYVGTAAFVAVVAALVALVGAPLLPPLIVHGHFQPLFLVVVGPAIVVADVLALGLLARNVKSATTLQIALSLSLLTSALDAALNVMSTGRYTPTWYVGKIEMLMTASIVAVTLLAEVAELYRRAASLATIDPLTGLGNRRSLSEGLTWALGHARRESHFIAMIVIDIDEFKKYNDAFGHAAGDRCLKRVASALRGQLQRPNDLLSRFGGEEFVAVLVDCDEAATQAVAERLRSTIEALQIAHAPGACGPVVTVSLGASALAASSVRDNELFEAADRALYVAKDTGRNRCHFGLEPATAAVVLEPATAPAAA
jgi:diguanylate cyclase (GGDEF)-like protein